MSVEVANWFKDERAIAELNVALNNEYVRRAISIVMRLGLPMQKETPVGVDLLEFGALSNASREGYFQALRNLEALATAPTPAEKKQVARPWEYLLSEEPKKAPAKTRKPRAKK